jgi:outer membrane protein TolC
MDRRYRPKAAQLILLSGFAVVVASWGQIVSPGTTGAGSTRAMPLPLSGRDSAGASVSTEQKTENGGIETLTGSVQVNGNFQGSAPSTALPPGAITLTLADAVQRGLQANLGTLTADNSLRAARAERLQALSSLLPNISATASDTSSQVNLAAFGFKFNVPPGLNFSIPTVVGPFNYSQAQAVLSLSVYDLVLRRNWQATKESERASVLSAKDARELVVLAVAGTYLQTVATAARIESQQAQVENAQAVNRQAEVRRAAGTNARIEVVRTLVELQTQQQRLNSLESDLRKQTIVLARLIGVPLDRSLILSERLAFNAATLPDTTSAVQQAFQHRSDLEAAEAQVRAAERVLSAARAERLPSVSLNADYGILGTNPVSGHGVYSVTGSVSVPIWQGGRIRGGIEEAEAALRQRKAELADQRGRVEQDVRTALIELETAMGQVRLAETNRDYANETLMEARDRANLGVTTTVEVVQAQEQVAGAESDYISSLFSFDLARLALSRATGQAEADLPSLLTGSRP